MKGIRERTYIYAWQPQEKRAGTTRQRSFITKKFGPNLFGYMFRYLIKQSCSLARCFAACFGKRSLGEDRCRL